VKAYFNKETVVSLCKKVLTSPFFWVLVLTVFLLRTILFTPGTPHHGDLTYPTTIVQYQKELYPLWNESTSDSNLESIDRGFSLLLVLLVRLVGGEVDLLSKLYFFIPLFISGVTTVFLTKYILQKVYPDKRPNTFALIIAAFTYMISPWVLEQVQAPFFWLSYAVTPGIILLAYRFFSERRLLFGFGLAILWTVASTTPHYTIFSFLIIFFAWLCTHIQFQFGEFKGLRKSLRLNCLSNFFKYTKINWFFKKYLKDMKLWLLLIIVFLALNAYWIVTTIFLLANGSVTPGYVFTPDMLSLFSTNAHLPNILSGTDQWISWWPGQYSSFTQWLTYFAMVALPATMIIAIWRARKGNGDLRLFYVLIGIWIIGVFFALGGNNPVYTWLATGSPLSSAYGWLLRVPGKISYLLWPAYTISAGIVVQSIYAYYLSKKRFIVKKVLVLATVVLLLIGSTGYAVLKADDYFNYYYAPVPIPSEYQQAFNYIGNNLTDARVADLARYENGTNVRYENLTAIEQSISLNENKTTTVYSDGGNDLNHSTVFWLNYDQTFESSYNWNEHRIAGYLVPRSITMPSIGNYHFTYSGTWEPAYAHFQENVSRTLWYSWVNGSQLVATNDTISRLENVNQSAASWFPVYGVNYVLYHNDIFNTTLYGDHDLEVLNATGLELMKQWGGYLYLYHVPQTFGRVYTLNSTINETQPPTSVDVAASGAKIYDVMQVDPTHWEFNVDANQSFTLIFSEGFDPFWVATVQNGTQTTHIPSEKIFGSINSFNVTQKGQLKITLIYEPQGWLNEGIIVSVLLLIAVSAAFVVRFYFLNKRALF